MGPRHCLVAGWSPLDRRASLQLPSASSTLGRAPPQLPTAASTLACAPMSSLPFRLVLSTWTTTFGPRTGASWSSALRVPAGTVGSNIPAGLLGLWVLFIYAPGSAFFWLRLVGCGGLLRQSVRCHTEIIAPRTTQLLQKLVEFFLADVTW